MSQAGERQRGPGEGGGAGPRSPAEWVSAGVAAALLLAVVGLLVFLWVGRPETPPLLLVARAGPIRPAGEQFYVPVAVRNVGSGAVEAVVVRAELRRGGAPPAEAELEFAYLAGDEEQQGGFVFAEDPRTGDLELRVVAYRLP